MNCHYTPKSIVKKWAYPAPDGQVRYYDTVDKSIKILPPKKLFSEEDIFTKDEEILFNEIIETPLGELQNMSKKSTLNYNQIEAIALYNYFQVSRFTDKNKDEHINIKNLSDSDFRKYIVSDLLKQHNIVIANCLAAMFLPEVGFFPIPILHGNNSDSTYKIIFSFPLNPQKTVMLMPKYLDEKEKEKIYNRLQSYSVGIYCDKNTKLLIPEEMHSFQSESDIVEYITANRIENGNLWTMILERSRLVNEMFSRAGILNMAPKDPI